jgi:predicted acylesterase/phospholipase RssA
MKIGLALSGGGFRATLYHIGLVRYLRDAGLLSQVTDIAAVSGGSVFAAHLGLNWGRYTGSDNEFDEAARELLSFVRLDVRNRILRRYPFGLALHWPRRLLGLSNRKLTRAGMLEYHYEKYLYGDTSLFQLPEHPRLHLLATNLSEGRLCSFRRDGLRMIRRERGHTYRIVHTPIGLATVPMAVAASSAFPGFFPPFELSGDDVGTKSGEFGRQAFTDGGVYDNLSVRIFRILAQTNSEDPHSWDGVLVSDVGKPFEVLSTLRSSGLIRTAMRASDILWDRVWQLENETFKDIPGYVFARVTDLVDPDEDPTALHPEIQRQLPSIRTDLDRFSDLEISSLVQHGYAVGRKACRARPDIFGTEHPANAPWDPIRGDGGKTQARTAAANASRVNDKPTDVTRKARLLHDSAVRRIWSTLLDYRDWVSYIYVPIIVPILVLLPYFVAQTYERSRRVSQIVDSLTQGSRDLEQMTQLLEGPVTPWTGEKHSEELGANDKVDLTGYLILQDLRIIDLRAWKPASDPARNPNSLLYGYRRLKVQKNPDNASNNRFRVSVLAISPETQIRFPPQQLKPKLYSRKLASSNAEENLVHWEVEVDFLRVPPGDAVDIIYEHLSPGLFVRDSVRSSTLAFEVEAETAELSRWILLPEGKEYQRYHLIRYPTGRPQASEHVQVVTEYLAKDFTILAFKLLSLRAGYTYEITWFYR